MDNKQRDAYVMRNDIMKLLSNAELERVTKAEPPAFAQGEEYIDLTGLDQGVLRADGRADAGRAHLLSRSAVREPTWNAILGLLPKAPRPSDPAS